MKCLPVHFDGFPVQSSSALLEFRTVGPKSWRKAAVAIASPKSLFLTSFVRPHAQRRAIAIEMTIGKRRSILPLYLGV